MIIIDSNELNKTLKGGITPTQELAGFIELHGYPVESASLDCGDVSFFTSTRKLIGLELKKPDDLLSSISDGRLLKQLPAMLETYDMAYLVIEGEHMEVNWTTTGKVVRGGSLGREESAWTYHHVNSILSKFEAGGGHVRHVADMNELAGFILSLKSYHDKDEHKEEVFIRRKTPLQSWKSFDNPVAELYERITGGSSRGIGIQRALALAEEYPRPADLAGVGWTEISKIKVGNRSFGKVNAKKVESWFGGV